MEYKNKTVQISFRTFFLFLVLVAPTTLNAMILPANASEAKKILQEPPAGIQLVMNHWFILGKSLFLDNKLKKQALFKKIAPENVITYSQPKKYSGVTTDIARLFRRIENTPHIFHSSRNTRIKKKLGHVKLRLVIKRSSLSYLFSNYRKHWKIENTSSGRSYSAVGLSPTFHLKPGSYRVTLTIDKAISVRDINLHKNRNTTQVVSLNPNFSIITAKSTYFDNYLLSDLQWNIQGETLNKVTNGRGVTAVVSAGNYIVSLKLGQVSGKKNIQIKANQHMKVVINIPTAKVRLSAWDGAHLIGDSNTQLELYYGVRTVGRNKVFDRRRKHLSGIVVPGIYTAVLKARNKYCKKIISIKEGSNKEYKLNLKEEYCI